jgi:hypothetical protein
MDDPLPAFRPWGIGKRSRLILPQTYVLLQVKGEVFAIMQGKL